MASAERPRHQDPHAHERERREHEHRGDPSELLGGEPADARDHRSALGTNFTGWGGPWQPLAEHAIFHGPSKTLVCTDFRDTQEEVLVFADPKAPTVPVLHGKGLLATPLSEKLQCVGEATGILLFEPGDHDALARTNDWVIRFSTAKTRSEHEDVTQRLMSAGRMQIAGFERSVPFMECDTPDEYTILTKEMYPRLRALLGF